MRRRFEATTGVVLEFAPSSGVESRARIYDFEEHRVRRFVGPFLIGFGTGVLVAMLSSWALLFRREGPGLVWKGSWRRDLQVDPESLDRLTVARMTDHNVRVPNHDHRW